MTGTGGGCQSAALPPASPLQVVSNDILRQLRQPKSCLAHFYIEPRVIHRGVPADRYRKGLFVANEAKFIGPSRLAGEILHGPVQRAPPVTAVRHIPRDSPVTRRLTSKSGPEGGRSGWSCSALPFVSRHQRLHEWDRPAAR